VSINKLLKKYKAQENKNKPNDVLPPKVNQDVPAVAKHWHMKAKWARRKEGAEMGKKKFTVDPKIYEGVRAGLAAARAKQAGKKPVGSKTICMDIERVNQRLFTLPDFLEEHQVHTAAVSLNGTNCVESRDFTISGNILNWVSDRKLYKSDVIGVRYSLLELGSVPFVPVTSFQAINGIPIQSLNKSLGGLAEKLSRVESALKTDTKSLKRKLADVELTVESLDTDYDDVLHQVGAINESVNNLEELAVQEMAVEEAEVEEPQAEEDEEMIAPGVKVWHRLSEEGPWIVVQPTVLNVNSRQEGGDENRFKQSYVELAWTVQTPDGVRDFAEVVLTTRTPKKASMSWSKKIAIGVAGVATAAAVVHAPLILKLLGLIQ